MKIAIVLGTRPEIIKMAPIILFCEQNKLDYFVIHTGQHYSYELDKVFFEQLELPEPRYNLEVGSGKHGKQTALILDRCEDILSRELPDIVLVEGDTNSVLGGALAASKLDIKVGHVEAGLRSYDMDMPEEKNRVVVDHISDFLFCPTEESKSIALKEGIEDNKIFVTGNTIVDSVMYNIGIANKKSKVLETLGLQKQGYFLMTLHRQENVDDKERLISIMDALEEIYANYNLPIIYPIHPRTEKMFNKFEIKVPKGVKIIKPLDFFDFLWCEKNAKLILTDSGGVQEEACILKVPCVTLRDSTERPETVKAGSNILVHFDKDRIIPGVKQMLGKDIGWENPFGDGKSGERIIRILGNEFN